MPVERLTPERRRELTREALITAAAEVFTAKGFNGASLDEIADVAGFTRGAIYSNFGSKEELVAAVIDHYRDTLLAGVMDAMESGGSYDPMAEAEAASEMWAQVWVRQREYLALALELRLYALRNPRARERVAALERQNGDKMAAFIEDEFAKRGVALGVPARDLADVGRAAVMGLEQMAAIDEENAENYQRLVGYIFTLLAQAAIPPAG